MTQPTNSDRRHICHCVVAAISLLIVAEPLFAQDTSKYPSRTIQLLEGFQAGGGSDLLDRVIAPKLSERLGQSVVVVNRPGAATTIAAKAAAAAPPDGYTLFMAVTSALAPSAALYPNLDYEILKDFSFITTVAYGATVLLVNPSLPVNSVEELVQYSKKHPGKISYGSAGIGSPLHMAAELFKRRTGADLTHIPYKGSGAVVTALLSGEVQVGFSSIAPAKPLISAGKVKALAVTSPKRIKMLADVPTLSESGYPGFEVGAWYGLLAPVGTPSAIVNLLNAEVAKVVTLPDVQSALEAQGLDPISSTPERFRSIMQNEVATWAKVIKDANIKLE